MTDIVERLHEEGLGFGIGPAGLCQEAAEEIERLRHRLIEAEAAVWRVYPNSHTVGGNPDPFEGSGETYWDAYHRLRAENERLREALAWYGEQARLARLIHSEGDAGRHALANDGGKRAAAALAKGGE